MKGVEREEEGRGKGEEVIERTIEPKEKEGGRGMNQLCRKPTAELGFHALLTSLDLGGRGGVC